MKCRISLNTVTGYASAQCRVYSDILKLETAAVGKILTVAQACFPESQFSAFKKLVFDHFHGVHKEQLKVILAGSDKVMAVPQIDSISKKGGCPMSG